MATSPGIPVPDPMDIKGDLANNWAFFKELWTNYIIATELDTKNQKIRVATILVTTGKEALQIYCHLTMTKEEHKNPKEILEKLESYFKPKRNIIYKISVFFSCDQESNETIDAYLASLRRLASSCEFSQLEEELIRDRIVLGIKDGGIQACMLREPSLTLDQAAIMC